MNDQGFIIQILDKYGLFGLMLVLLLYQIFYLTRQLLETVQNNTKAMIQNSENTRTMVRSLDDMKDIIRDCNRRAA